MQVYPASGGLHWLFMDILNDLLFLMRTLDDLRTLIPFSNFLIEFSHIYKLPLFMQFQMHFLCLRSSIKLCDAFAKEGDPFLLHVLGTE